MKTAMQVVKDIIGAAIFLLMFWGVSYLFLLLENTPL